MVNFVLNTTINRDSETTFKFSKRYRCMLSPFIPSSLAPLWSLEELKGYILFLQSRLIPLLSAEAQLILTRYYQYVRGHNNSVAQATVRLLESLIRLAQAHARLMMRNRVVTMVCAIIVNDDNNNDDSQ